MARRPIKAPESTATTPVVKSAQSRTIDWSGDVQEIAKALLQINSRLGREPSPEERAANEAAIAADIRRRCERSGFWDPFYWHVSRDVASEMKLAREPGFLDISPLIRRVEGPELFDHAFVGTDIIIPALRISARELERAVILTHLPRPYRFGFANALLWRYSDLRDILYTASVYPNKDEVRRDAEAEELTNPSSGFTGLMTTRTAKSDFIQSTIRSLPDDKLDQLFSVASELAQSDTRPLPDKAPERWEDRPNLAKNDLRRENPVQFFRRVYAHLLEAGVVLNDDAVHQLGESHGHSADRRRSPHRLQRTQASDPILPPALLAVGARRRIPVPR